MYYLALDMKNTFETVVILHCDLSTATKIAKFAVNRTINLLVQGTAAYPLSYRGRQSFLMLK